MSDLLDRNTKLKGQLAALEAEVGKDGEGAGGAWASSPTPPPLPPPSSPAPSSSSSSRSAISTTLSFPSPSSAPLTFEEFAESFAASGLRMTDDPGSRIVSVRLPKIEPPPPPQNESTLKQLSHRVEVAKELVRVVDRARESGDPEGYLEGRVGELERLVGGRREKLKRLIEDGDRRIIECEEVLGRAGL